MTTELGELRKAYNQGKWGFSHQLLVGQSTAIPLITLDLPSWMARPWTISTAAMLFSNGVLSTTNAPPDPPNSQTVMEIKLRIDWGIDSARESAEVDYNWGGNTFQIHAANVRVYLLPPPVQNYNTTRLPILNGWISPFAQGRGATDFIGPTWTHAFSFNINSTAFVPIPARAIAYRMVPLRIVDAVNVINVFQEAGGVDLDVSCDLITEPLAIVDGGAVSHLYPTRSSLIPLVPYASLLKIQTAATTDWRGSIQFLLDMG